MSVVSRVTRAVCVAGLLLGCSGCMSLEHLLDNDQKLEMYGGTKSSVDYINDDESSFFGSFVRLLDLPLTAVFDTLILPVSAPVELSRG